MKHTTCSPLKTPLTPPSLSYHSSLRDLTTYKLPHCPSSKILTGSVPSLSFASERSEPSKPSGMRLQ
jgi:hypothetical protein